MKDKLDIIVITQDDPFYIPVFFESFLSKLNKDEFNVKSIISLCSFNESKFELAKRALMFYGFFNFLKRGTYHSIIKILDKLNLLKDSTKALAKKYNIPFLEVEDANDEDFIDRLEKQKPGVILSVSATQIFKSDLLKLPKWGCINVHAAKLPEYRGMMPNFWAMYHGEDFAGLTVHTMDEKIDKGKIILQDKVPIKPDDSLNDLMIRSKKDASNLVIRVLEQIRDGTVELKNYEGKGSYFTFPTREEVREFKKRGYRL